MFRTIVYMVILFTRPFHFFTPKDNRAFILNRFVIPAQSNILIIFMTYF